MQSYDYQRFNWWSHFGILFFSKGNLLQLQLRHQRFPTSSKSLSDSFWSYPQRDNQVTPLNVADIPKHFTVRHISCVFGEKSGASAAFLLDWPQRHEKYMKKYGTSERGGKLSLNGTPCVTTSAYCKLSYIERRSIRMRTSSLPDHSASFDLVGFENLFSTLDNAPVFPQNPSVFP